MFNSLAASRVNTITRSATMQVTGEQDLFSLLIRLLNGPKQVSSIDLVRDETSWVASRFCGNERPSGMVSKRKDGRPQRASGPRDRRSRWWLNSVLTKVIMKPLEWRILASLSIGLIWPWAGAGKEENGYPCQQSHCNASGRKHRMVNQVVQGSSYVAVLNRIADGGINSPIVLDIDGG
ncbi:hypothetical protein Ccrd_013716 [Cynara cardunculus var. scolymus]|uniref:Uncharacterized protein n=1 Tax=Cynara cardunculus var. scolymus TaxID=59895 RepID=A0A103YF45_CYNCS|nr:hypothetical protein Ccrd_013716 [Cynara cardunculus var. scolymus]